MKSRRSCHSADEHRMPSAASKSDTVMGNVELQGGGGGLAVERDAPTHWPFTSCLACSIFNVSQLTAAHTGSLVRNATHTTTPAWQAHALVVLLSRTGLPNTPKGGERGVQCLWLWYLYFPGWLRSAGDARPLLPALVADPPGPGTPGANEARSQSRGLGVWGGGASGFPRG